MLDRSLGCASLVVWLALAGAASAQDTSTPPAEPQPAGSEAEADAEAEAGDDADADEEAELPERAPEPVDPARVEPVTFELDNGLRVILLPVPGRRHVAVCTTYDVGSRHVPMGYTGLAHLTEHLMFSGTDAYDGERLDRWLEEAGVVSRNAETHPDRTLYYNVLPASHIERALWLDATRMARTLAGLDSQRLETQRRVVLHEGRQRGRHGSIGRLASLLFDHLYDSSRHPYRRVFEHEEDVAAIRLANVQRFFQEHYRPENATVSVVGGFDVEQVRAAVHRYFDPIVATGPAHRARRVAPTAPMPVERRVTFDAHVDHDQLILRWPTPAYFAPGDAEMDLLASLLRRSSDGPLYEALRRSGLATELSVSQHSGYLGSYLEISVTAARGHSTSELLEATDRVLRELRDNPPDERWVGNVRGGWETAYRLSIENIEYVARHLGLRTPDGDVVSPRYEVDRYRAITPESFNEAFRRWILPRRRLIFFVASNPSAPPEGSIYSVRDIDPEDIPIGERQ